MPQELPDMNSDLMKQLVFDCAMHLLYEEETYTREDVAEKLLHIIGRHDDWVDKNKIQVVIAVTNIDTQKTQYLYIQESGRVTFHVENKNDATVIDDKDYVERIISRMRHHYGKDYYAIYPVEV